MADITICDFGCSSVDGCSGSCSAECPFDARLARTPYLVIPKLALQAMPMAWRNRLEALLCEADDAGMETPDYYVFRQGPAYTLAVRSDSEDDYSRVEDVSMLREDPWADYRHGDIQELCPTFSPLIREALSPTVNPIQEKT